MGTWMLAPGLVLAALPAFAADMDGNWAGSLDASQWRSSTGPDGMMLVIRDGRIMGGTPSSTASPWTLR